MSFLDTVNESRPVRWGKTAGWYGSEVGGIALGLGWGALASSLEERLRSTRTLWML